MLARDLASAQAEIAELKKEKEALRDKLADQKKLADAAIVERDVQKKESADARTKHRMLQSQVDELRDKLSSMNSAAQEGRQGKLELEKLKAENKVLRVDREQYRDKLAEVERTARALPAASGGKAATENNQFWMYAFLVLVRGIVSSAARIIAH